VIYCWCRKRDSNPRSIVTKDAAGRGEGLRCTRWPLKRATNQRLLRSQSSWPLITCPAVRRDHQQPKADDVGECVRDLIRHARVFDTGSHAIGEAKPLLHLRKTSIPPSDDSRPPSNLATIVSPETGDGPGSGGIGSFMAGVAFLKWRSFGLALYFVCSTVICGIPVEGAKRRTGLSLG
jgi:hypothetical protein